MSKRGIFRIDPKKLRRVKINFFNKPTRFLAKTILKYDNVLYRYFHLNSFSSLHIEYNKEILRCLKIFKKHTPNESTLAYINNIQDMLM